MNTENLEGYACPKCGHTESFQISAGCIALVEDDGIEHATDYEWDNDSYCRCGSAVCEYFGTVGQFRKAVEAC